MKYNKIAYVLLISGLVASSCSKDGVLDTLSPNGKKTPLALEATIGTEVSTKASDKNFDANENLVAYLRHVVAQGTEPESYSSVAADKAPRLVSFTYTGSSMTAVDASTNKTSDLAVSGGLYWDDFSDSSSDDTDLRTPGHFLESYYGYGFNGGTPTTALDNATGVVGWAAPSDQSSAEMVKKADLLWSSTQAPVSYNHSTGNATGTHGTLTIPYTHAMSKVSVNIVAGEGFSAGAFVNTTVKILGFNNKADFSAADAAISNTTSADITMYGASEGTTNEKPSRLFSAMTVPQTSLTEGMPFLQISDIDGNNYNLNITSSILSSWATGLESASTKPGVHYFITVNVSKVKVSVTATLQDWSAVSAEGTGIINFSADIVTSDKANGISNVGASFDLFRLESTGAANQDKSNSSYGSKVTTSSYTSAGWVNSPAIYWENGFTDYYFRGLALYSGSSISSVDGSLVASKGKDLVWATTPEHVGKESDNTEHTYQRGQAINPRTSEVPMEFEHIMSQVSVKLATDATNVPIQGAKMYVTGLYDKGTVNVEDGSITTLSSSVDLVVDGLLSSDAESGSKFSNVLMIPQSLVNNEQGVARSAKTTLYLREDLTDIYSDGTSVSDGDSSETYVTATLDKVLYTQGEADSFNAALPGHISVTDIKTPSEYYSKQEADAFNASNMIPDSEGRNPGDEGYEITYPSDYIQVQEGDEKTPAVYYTEEEVRTHNESLPGAIHEGDFKLYKTNASSIQKNIGEVKSSEADSQIILTIILADGTTYSIALSNCVVSGSDGKITEWERGKNYTYTIILSKEEIKFLALVKDWDTTVGSGNADLDWD